MITYFINNFVSLCHTNDTLTEDTRLKRFAFLLLFVTSLLLSFGCCTNANNFNSAKIDLIDHLKDSTAALVIKADNGAYMPFCSAVWINKTDMVTAKHCVADDDDEDKVTLNAIVEFQIYKDFDNTYPYSKNKKAYLATVIAAGKENEDLAILRSIDLVEHGIATIATYEPKSGQVAHHIGHPRALQWSYIRTYVSEPRILDVEDGRKRHMLNLVGFVWKGSSGGGAFDNGGNLLGICSWLLPAPGQTAFVHVDVVREVLKRNKIQYYVN